MSDELEGLHVVFVFVQLSDVVFEVYFWFTGLFLHFFEEKINVLVSSLLDFRGYVDIGDEWPGKKEVGEKFFENFFGDGGLFRRHDHLEWYSGLILIVISSKDVHVL